MDAHDAGRPRDLSVLWRIISLVSPHRLRFTIATTSLLLGSGLSLLYPQAARLAIDFGIQHGDLGWLRDVTYGLIVLLLVHAVLVWTRHYLMSWLGERVVADLRTLVFSALLTMSASWYQSRQTGELVSRLAADVTVIEGIVGSELSVALRNVVQLVGGIILLLVLNVKLTFYCLLIVPLLSLSAVVFGRIIRRMSRTVQDYLATASGYVQESVSAIQTVQAFVRESAAFDAYRKEVATAFDQALSLARWRAGFLAMVSTAGYFGLAAIVWLGGQEVIQGTISPGDLASFLLYSLMVASSLASVAGLWGSLQRAAGATERLFDIIDTKPAISNPPAPRALPDLGGTVAFESVTFAYPARPDDVVLSDLTLTLNPGEMVAIVGASGAGKTTLTQLLLRFYDVDQGRVTLEGVDIRELHLEQLRSVIAVVAQEPVLFSGTIRDNIAYARDDVAFEDVRTAARDAHAHDFIVGFTNKYDTVVGESGIALSGGQRQRIAIARAILASPRILILDEATSNLDAKNETLVHKALTRLMRGRTTLIIAHRLSTVRDAHRIAFVDRGRIEETGTHDELMALGGGYYHLVAHQVVDLT